MTNDTPTCKQHLVSGYSLHSLQHVAGKGKVGTLGLRLELAHHGSKDRILLHRLFQRLQGLVKSTDIVSIQLWKKMVRDHSTLDSTGIWLTPSSSIIVATCTTSKELNFSSLPSKHAETLSCMMDELPSCTVLCSGGCHRFEGPPPWRRRGECAVKAVSLSHTHTHSSLFPPSPSYSPVCHPLLQFIQQPRVEGQQAAHVAQDLPQHLLRYHGLLVSSVGRLHRLTEVLVKQGQALHKPVLRGYKKTSSKHTFACSSLFSAHSPSHYIKMVKKSIGGTLSSHYTSPHPLDLRSLSSQHLLCNVVGFGPWGPVGALLLGKLEYVPSKYILYTMHFYMGLQPLVV